MDLTKWPRLLVRGKPVTKEQAAEIIIRTDYSWTYVGTNNRYWEKVIKTELTEAGYPPELEMERSANGASSTAYWEAFRIHSAEQRKWKEDHGILDLWYIAPERIASSWLGGPHGWVNWDGIIGCDSFNIGKWPTMDEVTEDWTDVARAFPYLDLKAQLVPEEGEATTAAATWSVRDGKVVVQEGPMELLTRPRDFDLNSSVMFDSHREIGCTRRQLHDALEIIK